MGKHELLDINRLLAGDFSEYDERKKSMQNHPAGTRRVPIVPFDELVYKYYGDNADLLLRKHRDYGAKNISQSPGGPLNGLRVRMWDKIARINNLIDSGATPENESLKDSFQDLANYATIAMLVIDGNWPNE